MPRNISELKSGGGDNSYAVPPRWKVGGRVPPSPTDRRPWSRRAKVADADLEQPVECLGFFGHSSANNSTSSIPKAL